jgi:fructoselysine 6-kinase
MARILGIGDNTVDVYVDQGVQFPGGNAVNVAVLTGRLGAETAYLGCIGSDFLGDLVRDALLAEHVDISHVRFVDKPNSWSRIRHTGNDRYFDGNNPSGRGDYRLTDEDFSYISTFDLAHSSVYSNLEDDLERIGAAAQELSFDYSNEYSDDYFAVTAPHIDIAFVSAPGEDDEACRELARHVSTVGPALTVVTRGEKGVLAFDGKSFFSHGIAAAQVVDTLGAGDGFISGFLVAKLARRSLPDALQQGAEYAASVCTYRGAFGHEAPLRAGQPGLWEVPQEADKPAT